MRSDGVCGGERKRTDAAVNGFVCDLCAHQSISVGLIPRSIHTSDMNTNSCHSLRVDYVPGTILSIFRVIEP